MENDWSAVPPLCDVPRPDTRRPIPETPEIGALLRDGWELLSENPVWCFLPCVWPMEHCGWLPDVRERRSDVYRWDRRAGPDYVHTNVAWSDEDYEQEEREVEWRLREGFGLTPLPGGRLWLLRTPPAVGESMEQVYLDVMDETCRRVGPYERSKVLATVRLKITDWSALEG